MPQDPKITAIIEAKDRATAVLGKFGASLKSVSVIAAGAFAVSVGVKAVKAASEFETALANVSTLISGDTTQAMEELEQGIIRVSQAVPKSPQELGAAAYDIVSAGITDMNDALKVLEASSKLAVGGLGDTKEAVNLMTGALNAFKSQNISAEDAADIFFKTVKSGKTTVADLSQAFGQVAPIAATVGVRLEELQAATAALTTANIPTAIAQTQLRSAMVALIKPSKQMEDLLTAIGVSSGTAAIEQFGLVGTMQKLTEAADGNQSVLAEAFGRVEGLNAALSLAGEQGEAFATIMADMTSGTGALDEAVEKQSQTWANQLQLLKNEFFPILNEFGKALIPVLIGGVQALKATIDALSDAIAFVIEKFQRMKIAFQNAKNAVSGGFSSAISGVKGLLGFQSGGIVPGPLGFPQLAVVHGGEKVVPSSGLRGPGGSSIVVNVTGNTISSALDMRDLADEIGKQIMSRLKTAQNI